MSLFLNAKEQTPFSVRKAKTLPHSSQPNFIPAPLSPEDSLKKTWSALRPPVSEKVIVGKWFAVVYQNHKGKDNLYVGKLERRFLHDEQGDVQGLQINCLKPRCGLETILEETPKHLLDIHTYPLFDVIWGPVDVIPMSNQRFNVPSYNTIVDHFNSIKSIDRKALMNSC